MISESTQSTQTQSAPESRAAVPSAVGALTTRLTSALARAREALQPHAPLLPDGALARLDGLLQEFARHRVHIAIYGEVKAGKSTLLNAIAGAPLSPVAFDPLTSIPVRVTYGEQTTWRIGNRQLGSVEELEQLMRAGIAGTGLVDAPEVIVETDFDLLQLGGQVDLLDTPGVGSAAEFDAISADTLRSLDAVILVVRYPALFTDFTRRLMAALQEDIGKLFVVWNLDADCAELTAEERARHAENLRANVVGAHELFLVDARAGLRAMQTGDGAASVASGLTACIAALTRFASSGVREITALREATKRANRELAGARSRMALREEELDRLLADARKRLEKVQARAAADTAAAQSGLAEFEATVTRLGLEVGAAVATAAADLRRHLARSRRRWIWRADAGALETSVRAATEQYADALAAADQATVEAVKGAAAGFDTSLALTPRGRIVPAVERLMPEERAARATGGRAQLLRRAVWCRWYLPGLASLAAATLTADQQAHDAHVQATLQAAHAGAAATLERKRAEISRRAAAEDDRIKRETDFDARSNERERLGRDLPAVAAQDEVVAQIGAEARVLL